MAQYQKPPTLMAKIVNPALMFAIQKLGFRGNGLAVLAVKGRKTGRVNKVPVNPVGFDGEMYLVSPRGNAQWVRNIRAAGDAELSLGRQTQHITVTEIPDDEKLPILREYVTRFYSMVGSIMGVGKNATDEQLLAIAADHPVFRISR
jgi:deazaflavin-dependent oxidoreductase (nitroreductase family)